MQDEHALFLSHFLSLPPITTVDDWQVSPSITDSAVAMCVSESAVREGQGSLCTLAVGGGGTTLWQKIGSPRGEGPR